jgi:hypothetical protein
VHIGRSSNAIAEHGLGTMTASTGSRIAPDSELNDLGGRFNARLRPWRSRSAPKRAEHVRFDAGFGVSARDHNADVDHRGRARRHGAATDVGRARLIRSLLLPNCDSLRSDDLGTTVSQQEVIQSIGTEPMRPLLP